MPFLSLAIPVFLAAQGGKTLPPTLRSPAIIVLLKEGCPCARECRFALNALADACQGRVRFVGLLDSDAKKANALATDAELRFPVLPDPKGATIRRLGGKEGLDLRLIGKDGRLVGRWDGLDRANVAALVARLKATTGITIRVDEEPFTTLPKLGCPFRTSIQRKG